MLDPTTVVIRLVVAALISAFIGWEREHEHKPAGLRTHTLVAVGSCLVTLISFDAFATDEPTRIAAGIVTGIGFLGAGTIFKDKNSIHGLTTAASIWAVAAIGMAIGAGYIVGAVTTAIIVFLALKNPFHKANQK